MLYVPSLPEVLRKWSVVEIRTPVRQMVRLVIAGAMAEKGKSLEEIKLVALTVIESMGTIGVCLYPCSVPGSGPSFTLGASEVEVGLGIHGEAGVKRQELTPVRELIPSLVKTVLSSLGVDTKSVILIVNNLGGTTNLELTLVAKSAIGMSSLITL
ncbi:putative bifunctional ATP-dependent dihydroxyacetone kinase/FAD-AMP lyase (cyclizing) [Apostichopus japonicus]|uniref:Putative bifunctional ATP-dependent dihydroxyacetone kinase/FAD-AMP lyase (Cyclizing) n=1 Tax=Stichopus japonicus TaxID=307972 RepID=A0A2G8JHW2_STIJA|nr:putative bifunctional ATP-dependent dihydroxyacetone kinase/FAD-AMP lyase (cyclizing) [Apostichopus japonicus]